LRFYNTDSSFNEVTKETRWLLEFNNPITGADTVIYSDTSISIKNEQFLLDLGIALTIFDARFSPLDDFVVSDKNDNAYILFSTVDFISSSTTYTNSAHPWLSFVADADGTTLMNWIRGGTTRDGDWALKNQTYVQKRREDYYRQLVGTDSRGLTNGGRDSYTLFLDKSKQFGKIENATWSPYALASVYDNNPGYGYDRRERLLIDTLQDNVLRMNTMWPTMTELYSIDVVFTSDKSLWSRCPVVEISDDTATAIGKATRHNLRKSPSVDKNGNMDNTGIGMGWFPGYAICVETGERLNVMFGENSSMPEHNGTDMLFNPTSIIMDASGEYVMGGGHYLYIFGNRDLYMQSTTYDVSLVSNTYTGPKYDEGQWLHDRFEEVEQGGTDRAMRKNAIYKNIMWTAIPLSNPSFKWLEAGNDVTIRIRVSRPYQRWSSRTNVGVSNPVNNNMPLYRFSTRDLAALHNQQQIAANYMDSIYVTPNPYYGISVGYETSQLDTRVKFINVPTTCKIKIFTLDGVLIRSFDKPDDGTTYLEWDLKNSANIPIASGLYLIHIRDNTYNTEKTLKFLCIQRPVDVNAF
jgi:hypothetical protein